MASWYCQIDGATKGPLTAVELRGMAAFGEITPSTPIRREDRSDWIEARKIAGLEFPEQRAVQTQPLAEEAPSLELAPASESPSKPPATKRCPFCAEVIQQAAVKCKHCGEMLVRDGGGPSSYNHAPAMATAYSDAQPDLRKIAGKQRTLIYFILAGLVLELPIMLLSSSVPLLGLPVALVYLFFRVFVTVDLGLAAFQDRVLPVLLGIMTAIPCLGIILLLVINGKATSVLQRNGVKVGLMGADMSSIGY